MLKKVVKNRNPQWIPKPKNPKILSAKAENRHQKLLKPKTAKPRLTIPGNSKGSNMAVSAENEIQPDVVQTNKMKKMEC